MGKPKNNLAGRKFGLWTVLGDSGQRSRGNILWDVMCECGNKRVMRADNLLAGKTKSCGCNYHERHGMTGSRAYVAWSHMIQRCSNPNNSGFRNYMGRGISVCDRWLDFKRFHEDMGDPGEGMFIDRIDNNQGYSKENCRWATRTENNRNRRSCKSIYFMGMFRGLWEISEMCGVKASVLRNRLNNYKMTIEEAVSIPLHAKPRQYGDYI